MLDHVSVGTAHFERACAFYDATLAPLGYRRLLEFPGMAGYGLNAPQFWIGSPTNGSFIPAVGVHVAFQAQNRAAVDAFYEAALVAGGRDNGPPGLRPHYHPDYYGAFVIDPEGNRIEAVCHRSEADVA